MVAGFLFVVVLAAALLSYLSIFFVLLVFFFLFLFVVLCPARGTFVLSTGSHCATEGQDIQTQGTRKRKGEK
jgi:ABC-type transport system involved in cytochrome bd biosynthesis fused ATPase/permease subunit